MRILLIVPKMFTLEELSKINQDVPDDYEEKSKEFWDYVAEKLKTQREVRRLYYDSLTKGDKESALKFVSDDNAQCYNLVQKFVVEGATLQPTEDPLLLEETSSWIAMLKEGEDSVTRELLGQNIADRNKHTAKIIDETLKDGETGILFLASDRQISEYLPSDIRVIRVQPFDPADYLKSWLVRLRLKLKQAN